MAELIWDGKYDEHGNKRAPVRIELPFQTVETVNESVQERQRTLELSSSGHDPEWRNRLIWGDKKYVLPSLLPEFAGKVDLIYIDPPFDTGADFSFTTKIPGSGEDLVKQPSVMEQKAYRDTWGRGLQSYLHWFFEVATLVRDLLSESASIYVHLDWHVGHYAKTILDEVFGDQHFRSEIVWKRTTAHSDAGTYGQNHDVIHFYSKGDKITWSNPKIKYEDWYVDRYYRYKDADGRRFMSDNLSASGLSGGGYKYTWKGASGNWRCPETTMARLDAERRIFYTENGIPRYKRYLLTIE